MKYKFLSLLFLFIILIAICDSSFAVTYVNEEKISITLQDIDISASSYLMFYNSNDNIAELIVAPDDSKIYYNLSNSTFYSVNSSYAVTDFTYYYCVIADNIGGEWSSATAKSSFKYSNNEKIKQVGTIYPCRKSSNTFIDNLPEGVTWEDSFYISYSNGHVIMVLATGEGVWVNVNGNGIGNSFRTSYDSSTPLTLQQYIFKDHVWSVDGTNTGTHGYFNEAIYYSDDIINTDGTVFVSGMRSFFQSTPATTSTTVLATILGKMEMNQQITTTIVGLAVLLIPLLICLIGFWKAWQLLLKMLHKS